MGITIRQIVEEIGGGVADGRQFKAVQVGGPSGGCVPAELADTPVDYEALAGVGAIMGSGGLVVLDDARLHGRHRPLLPPLHPGPVVRQVHASAASARGGCWTSSTASATGQGKHGRPGGAGAAGPHGQRGSICGLGKTAPNPVLSTLRYFRDEYEAHLAGRCPAGKCKALIAYRVTDDCIGCTLCAQHCPADAIPMTPYAEHEIDQEKCTRCDTCRQVCPVDAVVVE